jgi:hypothetical protein
MNIVSEDIIKNPSYYFNDSERMKDVVYLSIEMYDFLKIPYRIKMSKSLVLKAIFMYINENNLLETEEHRINNSGFSVIKVKVKPDEKLLSLLSPLDEVDSFYSLNNLHKYLATNFTSS